MKETRFFQTIQVRLIIIYILLILIAMQVIGVYFMRTLEASFVSSSTESMNKQIALLASFVEPYLTAIQDGSGDESSRMYHELDTVVKNLNTISNAEIQIIDASGKILTTTSLREQSNVGKKNTETEVSRALQGVRYIDESKMDEAGHRYKVMAMPVGSGGKVIGAVYMVASMEDMYATLNRINRERG